MKRFFIILAVLLLIAVGVFYFFNHPEDTPEPAPAKNAVSAAAAHIEPTANPLLPSDLQSIRDFSDTVPLDTVPGSCTALVSRDYLLPANYVPKDLVEPKARFSSEAHDDKRKMRKMAAKALEKMFHAAEKKNVILCGVSGYRSYERQKSIYNRNVALHGKKATDALSAKPGSSEHQTGLTIDVSASSVSYLLTQRFADTKEGKWLAKNAHKYGYIVRYPKGKAKITGYSFEPWHIRFVGVTVATYLYKNKLTLEEYYGVSCNEEDETQTGVDVENPEEYETMMPSTSPSPSASPTATANP